MAIYSYTFSPYEKLAAARLNALISAINSHNHDGGSGGTKISCGDLANLSTIGNTAGNVVVLNGSGQLPAVDGSLLTGIVAPSALPVGAILQYGGQTAPTGFLMCDGSAVSRVTYATLFAAIGLSFGIGDGINTFNLPDGRRRIPYGASSGSDPGDAVVGSKNDPTPGTLSGNGSLVKYRIGTGFGAGASAAVLRADADLMVPYLALNFIIKY